MEMEGAAECLSVPPAFLRFQMDRVTGLLRQPERFPAPFG